MDRLVIAILGDAGSVAYQHLAQLIEEIGAGWTRGVVIQKVNTVEALHLCPWLDRTAVPTLLFFVDGRLRGWLYGMKGKTAILDFLRALDPSSDATLPVLKGQS